MIWSVAQTESLRERTAKRFLEASGFETYLPMIGVRKRIMPLFPAYIFVRLGETGWSQVDNTIGVLQLLRSSELTPARVGDNVVEAIRGQEKNGIVRLPEKKGPGWRVGEPVRVTGGTFLGHIGLFDGMAPRERVFVLLSLFGRQTRTEMAISEIHRLELVKAVR
jgi:transcriptional antiterminator RfaH